MKIMLATAQYPITAHTSFDAWRQHTTSWVQAALQQNAQLLLFPEYGSMELVSLFQTPEQLDLQSQVRSLERYRDDCWDVYAQLARQQQIILVAPSFPVVEGEKIYNRAAVFSPRGFVGFQDKYFMTRFENEDWGIDSGAPHWKIFEADWGCFGIQICYDIEFALGAHLLNKHGASLILAPSCTETIRGATRVHVGARARALENQCYIAVSQTVGEAPWSQAVDINYGYAAIYSTPDNHLPETGIIAMNPPQQPGWLIRELDLSLLETVRENGQVFNFRDHQTLQYAVSTGGMEFLKILC